MPKLRHGLVLFALLGVAVYALAEDLTLTTYYPSPRGVYQSLRATEDLTVGTRVSKGTLTVAGETVHTEFGECPAGYDWYDENGNGVKDFEGECKRTGIVITSPGYVGIGTTNPGYTLNVNGIVNATNFYKGGVPFGGGGGCSASGDLCAFAVGFSPWMTTNCYSGADCTGTPYGRGYSSQTVLWEKLGGGALVRNPCVSRRETGPGLPGTCLNSSPGESYYGPWTCAPGYTPSSFMMPDPTGSYISYYQWATCTKQ
ncbi:MAG: hypothetical protein HYY15_00810 [Candidatus Omnitrophica bacterium]|nr:hypothetical protein [Candidatus Omnitrophota bacterium]